MRSFVLRAVFTDQQRAVNLDERDALYVRYPDAVLDSAGAALAWSAPRSPEP